MNEPARHVEAATKSYTFQIVIEREPGAEHFTAYSPDLAGCFRRGRTLEEAKQEVRQALQDRLESLLAKGEPVSQSQKFLHVDEVTITVRA